MSIPEVLHTRLFVLAGTSVNVLTVLTVLLIIGLTVLSSRLLQRAVARYFQIRGVKDEGTTLVTARLVHYVTLAIGFGIAASTIGIKVTALFAAGAVFALAIGFAMQNISQNFISGVILLAERAIKPGDILEVEGRLVRVVHMGIRATVARTLDEDDLIIPNATLVQSMVKNHTLRDPLYRLRAPVGVVYSADMAQVRKVLEEAAKAIPWRVSDKDPIVLLKNFGSSSVDWEISVWLEDPWRIASYRSDLNEVIWWALKEAGIAIAFPQLDVHIDTSVEEAIRGVGRAR